MGLMDRIAAARAAKEERAAVYTPPVVLSPFASPPHSSTAALDHPVVLIVTSSGPAGRTIVERRTLSPWVRRSLSRTLPTGGSAPLIER